MKSIIACTDFSQNSSNAVKYAAALAKAAEARLILFHHFTYPVPATDMPMAYPTIFVEGMEDGFEKRLQTLKVELEKTYSLEIEYVLKSWDFKSDLEETFTEKQAGLVVMGMQGQSAVVNALVGNMTSTMIRRGHLPILVIPRGVAFHPVQKIIFPCDDHAITSPAILQPLLDLAKGFDAYIEVLTLFDLEKTPELVPNSGRSAAKENLDLLLAHTRHGYSYENELAVDKGILYEAARSTADMVAMIPHHHSFWSNLMNQSKTQQVAASIHLPLLVLGEKVENLEKAVA